MRTDRGIEARRPLFMDVFLGLTLALVLLGVFTVSGRVWGKKPAVWMCDDTMYSRTGPVGFDVIGPTVRPVPGCGDP
jgi:hypothetical protein